MRSTLDTRSLYMMLVVLGAKSASSIYASVDARGLYGDGASYLISIYSDQWFSLFDVRTVVQVLRQAPIVFLSKYTSATLFECGQVFTFVMLVLPTLLVCLCWFAIPERRKTWIAYPLVALLTGYAANSMQAIGEAAIASSYYWILLFLLLFRTRSTVSQGLFLLLCVPAFRLHEGAFPFTAVLLAAIAARFLCSTGDVRRGERLFVSLSSALLAAILVYQMYWVIYPQFPDDRSGIVRGLTRGEFLYIDGHFNLPFVTGTAALLALTGVLIVEIFRAPLRAIRTIKIITIAWTLFAIAAIAVAISVEKSFSAFAQLQSRYQPIFVSSALGIVMVLLVQFRLSDRMRMTPATAFIVLSLCATQTVADVIATSRWNAFVADLRSRLAKERGLIPWETTLNTGNRRDDVNWQLMNIGWVVPFDCIVFAPGGVVNAIVSPPIGTSFQPLDLQHPDRLPRPHGISYAPYERALEIEKLGQHH